jgi:hypothetical protein
MRHDRKNANDQLARIWKEVDVTYFKALFGICPEN